VALQHSEDLLCLFTFAGLAGQTQDEQGQPPSSKVTECSRPWQDPCGGGWSPDIISWVSAQVHGPPCLVPSSSNTVVCTLQILHLSTELQGPAKLNVMHTGQTQLKVKFMLHTSAAGKQTWQLCIHSSSGKARWQHV
jgi:hypothetical protein